MRTVAEARTGRLFDLVVSATSTTRFAPFGNSRNDYTVPLPQPHASARTESPVLNSGLRRYARTSSERGGMMRVCYRRILCVLRYWSRILTQRALARP